MSCLWSPKIRCLKSDTIIGRPLRSATLGSQPRRSFALVMSGFLLCGSSSVFGLNSILAFGSMVSCTTCTIKNTCINRVCSLRVCNGKGCWSTYLSKFEHGELAWVTEIERPDVLPFHQPHQSLNLPFIQDHHMFHQMSMHYLVWKMC